jgi:tRNA (guanine-N7-)-methyltransferase
MTENRSPYSDRLLFYGRRRGRKLRPNAVQNLNDGLKVFGVDPAYAENPGIIDPQGLFNHQPRDVFLEIGFGGGEYLAACATESPDCGFVGAEPFINGVASLCRHIHQHGIMNIRIWPEDVRLLLSCFVDSSFAGVFILFPDPWPKFKHRSRRILQPPLLAEMKRLIRPGGNLLLASDESVAKGWILQAMIKAEGFRWNATRPQDWRYPPQGWPGTRYMAKAEREGRIPNWFMFNRQD